MHRCRLYAIIQTGGHQVKVTPGGLATLYGTAGEPGAELTLDQVLIVEKDGGEILAGAPFVANARVIAVVDGETRGPKIRVFKKKRRKGMRRTNGHRSFLTQVRIKDILLVYTDMAHKKGQGSSRNGRDSNSQRLGVKAHDGNVVTGGTIIVRQRGRRFQAGLNAGLGKDDTIFAKTAGRVKFEDHGARGRVISIQPLE